MEWWELSPLPLLLMPVLLMALIGWLIFIGMQSRRQRERLRAYADFQGRLIDKIGSAKDFGEFLGTEGGRTLMVSFGREPVSAQRQILRGTERGIVCLAIGLGLLLAAWISPPLAGGLTIIGTILAACGLGFLVSCVVSYRVSKRLGLLDHDDPRSS